jgi:hypothetical protein
MIKHHEIDFAAAHACAHALDNVRVKRPLKQSTRLPEAGLQFNQVPQVKLRHAPFREPSHLLGIVPKQNSLLAELRESSALDKPESTGTNLRLSWLEY